jgi:hypothetical protein
MVADKKTNKPTRIGAKFGNSGAKDRVARRSGETI